MITPDFATFKKLSQDFNLLPVSKQILADLDTPVSAYLKIAQSAEYSFLYESAVSEEKLGRYSFLGIDPLMRFEAKGNNVTLHTLGSEEKHYKVDDPSKEFERLMGTCKLGAIDEKQLAFTGSAVGYMNYSMVNQFENIPQNNPDDMGFPDMQFIIPRIVVVFDHFNHRIHINAIVCTQSKNCDIDEEYKNACKRIDSIIEMFSKPHGLNAFESAEIPTGTREFKSNYTKQEFMDMVSKAKEYVRAGDIIQTVLSQRLELNTTAHPFDIYRALRSINPSPYMFYIRYGGNTIVASSPEVFVKCEKGNVTIRPIAGTRPRGENKAQDLEFERSLLDDEKEIAEHIMLVDLARNDIGRVCKMGSVKVDEFKTIERYSHVMHIVSNVVGQLSPDKNSFDLMRSCFPAGTVSGAPKVRAMQIIEELENLNRGPYAGAVCYFSPEGDFDSCITIRSILIKDGRVFMQAGAGIVFDSDPESEYNETLNKARGMLKAIDLAETFCAKNGN